MATYISRAAEKMRREGLVTPALQVFVTTDRFREQDRQYTGQHTVHLPAVTLDTTRLIKAALHGLERIWQPGFSYKKAGVVCLDLHLVETVQGTLSHAPDSPERVQLMAGLDAINRRYERGTVGFAVGGLKQTWALRSEQKSAAYTTQCRDLLARLNRRNPHAGSLAFDVKAKSVYDGELLFDLVEVAKLALFGRLFNLTTYLRAWIRNGRTATGGCR